MLLPRLLSVAVMGTAGFLLWTFGPATGSSWAWPGMAVLSVDVNGISFHAGVVRHEGLPWCHSGWVDTTGGRRVVTVHERTLTVEDRPGRRLESRGSSRVSLQGGASFGAHGLNEVQPISWWTRMRFEIDGGPEQVLVMGAHSPSVSVPRGAVAGPGGAEFPMAEIPATFAALWDAADPVPEFVFGGPAMLHKYSEGQAYVASREEIDDLFVSFRNANDRSVAQSGVEVTLDAEGLAHGQQFPAWLYEGGHTVATWRGKTPRGPERRRVRMLGEAPRLDRFGDLGVLRDLMRSVDRRR